LSGARHIASRPDHAPGFRGIKLNWDWVTRPLFGGALAAVVVAAIFGGAPYVGLFGVVAGIAAAREWHRMIGERVFGPMFFVTSAALIAAAAAQVLAPSGPIAWAILGLGAIGVAAYAALKRQPALWHGFGLLYMGTTVLSLLVLVAAPFGAWVIVGMFIAVWATDTGALVVGNLVGGPRLWSVLSPNKTWAGTLGGIAAAALAEALYIVYLHGNPLWAALTGALIAVVAHCGDLFESWVKRTFQRKDSGGLIPGHGGVLDRIDSTLFVAPILTLVITAAMLLGVYP